MDSVFEFLLGFYATLLNFDYVGYLTSWNGISQVIIGMLGVPAIYLSQCKDDKYKRIAPILGLLGQPFWFYSAFVTMNYGIFILCFFYSFAWFKGMRTYWFKKKEIFPPVELFPSSRTFTVKNRTLLPRTSAEMAVWNNTMFHIEDEGVLVTLVNGVFHEVRSTIS